MTISETPVAEAAPALMSPTTRSHAPPSFLPLEKTTDETGASSASPQKDSGHLSPRNATGDKESISTSGYSSSATPEKPMQGQSDSRKGQAQGQLPRQGQGRPRLISRNSSYMDIPVMNQAQFIQFCKTMYDMFTENPQEQELYHSIATVGTLLLQIGDVGKQFYARSFDSVTETPDSPDGEAVFPVDEEEKPGVDSDPKSQASPSSNIQRSTSAHSSMSDATQIDSDWSITFEQVLASMLTEGPLCTFFEKQTDIVPVIERFRNRRVLERTDSTAGLT